MLLAFAAMSAADVASALHMPALFSDHMVLQADQPAPVWGWAGSGTAVKARFVDSNGALLCEFGALAGPDGSWSALMPPLRAGTTGRLDLSESGGDHQSITDVRVGQVWLAGGQSNMDYPVGAANVSPETRAEAEHEAAEAGGEIRFFTVQLKGADGPQDDVAGRWTVASPATVAKCSAVAWYFGVAVQARLRQPVGLIISAVGSTPVESWIPSAELNATRASVALWARHQQALSGYNPQIYAKFERDYALWLAANPTPELQFAHPRPVAPYSPFHRSVPSRLYNGMIHGLEPYRLRGVIWFQADANARHPEEYPELIKTLIGSWRRRFGAELPFYYVEMNNVNAPQQNPVEGPSQRMPAIREAQNSALDLPGTGVVSSIDLGIAGNAHFPVKKPVGDRLANLALSEAYGIALGEVHSPQFRDYAIEGAIVRIRLDHAAGLRARGDGVVRGFAIEGADKRWTWSEGRIEGDEIALWSPAVPRPTGVRYAWADNPIISIVNTAGLPLRPFRTDKEQP